jgi:hypothetical protein
MKRRRRLQPISLRHQRRMSKSSKMRLQQMYAHLSKLVIATLTRAQRVFTYGTRLDAFLIMLSCLTSIGAGIAFPLMVWCALNPIQASRSSPPECRPRPTSQPIHQLFPPQHGRHQEGVSRPGGSTVALLLHPLPRQVHNGLHRNALHTHQRTKDIWCSSTSVSTGYLCPARERY